MYSTIFTHSSLPTFSRGITFSRTQQQPYNNKNTTTWGGRHHLLPITQHNTHTNFRNRERYTQTTHTRAHVVIQPTNHTHTPNHANPINTTPTTALLLVRDQPTTHNSIRHPPNNTAIHTNNNTTNHTPRQPTTPITVSITRAPPGQRPPTQTKYYQQRSNQPTIQPYTHLQVQSTTAQIHDQRSTTTTPRFQDYNS